jgi:hypothetical protein
MIGGPGRDRTGDLFHAMEARSQLRHRPTVRKEWRSANARASIILSQQNSLVKRPAKGLSAPAMTPALRIILQAAAVG